MIFCLSMLFRHNDIPQADNGQAAVRIALGTGGRGVILRVMRRGLGTTAIGPGIGLATALWLARRAVHIDPVPAPRSEWTGTHFR
jgi:hypothetical protein